MAPDESLLLPIRYKTPADSEFNFTEWWKIGDEKLSKPFDVGEEMVAELLRVLEIVSTFFNISIF